MYDMIQAVPAKPEMQFKDGDEVMARWPGSSLFFKAKVLYTLFVSNKLLNGKTDWSQIFCGNLHDPQEGLQKMNNFALKI